MTVDVKQKNIIKKFFWSEMDSNLAYSILRLRNNTFVVEQKCTEADLDNIDLQQNTKHYLIGNTDLVKSYCRVIFDEKDATNIKVGRVCTDFSYRKQGLSSQILQSIVNDIYPEKNIFVNAQKYLQSWYEKHGFVAQGNVFLECNIPHIAMVKRASFSKNGL